MPRLSKGLKIFWARPKIGIYFVPIPKILCHTNKLFPLSKFGFCAGTKVLEEALNAVKFSGWLKKFEPEQNILGPVTGQGISH